MTRSMERVREMLLMGYSHLGKIRAYSSLSMLSGHWKTKQNSANYLNWYMSYIYKCRQLLFVWMKFAWI
jgi:hypothetical protein